MENLEMQEHFSDQDIQTEESCSPPYNQINEGVPAQQQHHQHNGANQQISTHQSVGLQPGLNTALCYDQLLSGHQQTTTTISSSNSSSIDDSLHPQIAQAARHAESLPSSGHIQYHHHHEEIKVGESLMHSSESVDAFHDNAVPSTWHPTTPQLYSKKDINHNSFKESKESKERIEVFKKLRTQLSKLKNELLNQTDQSAKYTPFKNDPSKYLEKMLNLLKIINEVDANNNIAELRNEYDKIKRQLEKATAEIQKLRNEEAQAALEMQNVSNDNKKLHSEIKLAREQHDQEREQLELLIKFTKDQLQKDKEVKDSLQPQIDALLLSLTNEQQKSMKLQAQLTQALQQESAETTLSCGVKCIKEREKLKFFKQDYGKKIAEKQIEINELREFIKNRSQNDYQKRQEERKQFEEETRRCKDQQENFKKQTDKILKERDSEIRILQDYLSRSDPDMLQKLQTQDKICPDCKKKESKLADAEERVRNLTEYIKHRLGEDKQKYEEEMAKMREVNKDMETKIQTLVKAGQPITANEYQSKLAGILDKISKVANFQYEAEVQKQIESMIPEREANNPQKLNQAISELLLNQIQPQNYNEEIERSVISKIVTKIDLSEAEKEQIKEGKKQRKLCHQVIIEVERLIYMMNSLLVAEQTNLQDEQQKQQSKASEQRMATIKSMSDLFKKLMEYYLQLPHKLKPIFVMQKRYEQIIIGLYRAGEN